MATIYHSLVIFFLSLSVSPIPCPSPVKENLRANASPAINGFSEKVVHWSARSDNAWVITTRKALMTNDGGKHWREIDKQLGQIQCVHFLDSQYGWAVSESAGMTRIWRTTDGGGKWTIISELPISYFSLARQIEFVDALNGWMIGVWTVLRTTDGGISWQRSLSRSTPGVVGGPAHGAFMGPLKAWISSERGEVYRTTDGGQTWLVQTVEPGVTFTNISFANDSVGWLELPASLRFDGWLYQTIDGGRTWQMQPRIEEGTTLLGVSFIDQYQGWGVGQSSKRSLESASQAVTITPALVHTIDGGRTWQQIEVKISEPILWDVKFLDSQRGWLVGDEYLYYTADSGKNWVPVLRL